MATCPCPWGKHSTLERCAKEAWDKVDYLCGLVDGKEQQIVELQNEVSNLWRNFDWRESVLESSRT